MNSMTRRRRMKITSVKPSDTVYVYIAHTDRSLLPMIWQKLLKCFQMRLACLAFAIYIIITANVMHLHAVKFR